MEHRRWSHGLLSSMAVMMLAPPLPADAQETTFPPFSFGDVDFTRECYPNDAFERLLSLFGRGGASRPADDEVPVFDEPLYSAVSADAYQRLMFDDAADWHGLHLKGVELYHGIERGPANYTLVFDDPPEKVREVWNARGWNLAAVDVSRDVEGLEGYASVMVSSDEGERASVTCFRD
jgi:hypothetical protein